MSLRRIAAGFVVVVLGGLLVASDRRAQADAEPPAGDAAAPQLKRRDLYSAEYLVLQLGGVPDLQHAKIGEELTLSESLANLASAIRRHNTVRGDLEFPATIDESQARLWRELGLAARTKSSAQLYTSDAEKLQETARQARLKRLVTLPGRRSSNEVTSPEVFHFDSLRSIFPFDKEGRLPANHSRALIQMLQCEAAPSRCLLVDALAHSDGELASVGLAERAMYDPEVQVRQRALEALKQRPCEEYRPIFLYGLRHPWPPVADHAAEALVYLQDRSAMDSLKKIAEEPDPCLAFCSDDKEKKVVIRELVRVNHLRSCLLCHAPTTVSGKGLVVAPVPTPGQPLPVEYYGFRSPGGVFVRADITYLKQDFSLMQLVGSAKPWPDYQRFDFLVRTREATADEIAAAKQAPDFYAQRGAVLWAISELQREARPAKP
jgi:hypothetical protein